MQRHRHDSKYSISIDKGSNFSDRASFALRSLISPTNKNIQPRDVYAKRDRSYTNAPHYPTEPDSPIFNVNSPKHTKKIGSLALERNPSNNLSVHWPGASGDSPSNKSNIFSYKQPQFNAGHSHNPTYTLQNIQEEHRVRGPTLQALGSPNNKSVNYSENARSRAFTFSDAQIEKSSIASSMLLQKNAREIIKPELSPINNTHGDYIRQNRPRIQSNSDIYEPSISPPKSYISNPNNSPSNKSMKPLPLLEPANQIFQNRIPSLPGNEIQLLKFTIKPPPPLPPIEPDPYEIKRAELAKPLTELYLPKKVPQKPEEPKVDTVALSIAASKNECALKKAKSIRNVMYREGQRDPSLRYKPKFKFRLGIILWIMVYPYFVKKLADKVTKAKRSKINYRVRQDVKEHINHIAKFIKERCMKPLELIYSETKSLNFISKKDKLDKQVKELTAVKLEKAKSVSSILINILQELVIETSNQDLPDPLLEYLASISEDSYQVPSGLLFEFELVRLEFNQFAALRNMIPSRSKMIIGMFFLIRMFVFYFLTQPWAAKVKIKQTPLLVENLQIFSSILYHVVMDYFRGKVPQIPGNMDALPVDKKIGARDGPFVAFGDQAKNLTEPEPDDVILGLYSKKVLAAYFLSQGHAVMKMKSLVEEWLEEMYSRVHIVHVENGAKKAKQE